MNVTVATTGVALGAAENVIGCAVPGVSVMEEGLIVTPVGSPETAIVTWEEKPPLAVAVNDADSVLPSLRLPLTGEEDSEKSGDDGGGVGLVVEPPPPPQAVNSRSSKIDSRSRYGMRTTTPSRATMEYKGSPEINPE